MFILSETFSLKPIYLAVAAVGFSGSLWASPLSLGSSNEAVCTPNAVFVEPALPSAQNKRVVDNTYVEADDINGQMQNQVHATGQVIIERNEQTINADDVIYDQQQDKAIAKKDFTLTQGNTHITGQDLDYQVTAQQGTAINAKFETNSDEGRRLQGVGEELEVKGKNRYGLKQAQFNTCRPGDASWYIKSSSLDADYNNNIGVARNATIMFKDVPILYTPWMDFPLSGNRKSGFLPPTIKGGSNGFELATPYYLNLAPNYDATFTPHLMTNRGLFLGGDVRYLQPNYQGQIAGEYLNSDKKSDEDNRYTVSAQHRQKINDNIHFGIDYNQVSDDDYIRDFGTRSQVADGAHLNREFWLSHRANVANAPLSTMLTVQKYQTLQNNERNIDIPYRLMPRVESRWQKYYGKMFVNMMGQYTRFSHPTKQEGQRFVANPSVKWNFDNQWGFIRPQVGVHATYYDIDAWRNKDSRTKSRVLPMLSLDTGLFFDRETNWGETPMVQTLEPRLFYTYIPSKNQSDIPNFDASENSFTFSQLFRQNRFSGQDRINAANNVSATISTKFIETETGLERFGAGFGQRLYLKRDDVSLSGNVRERSSGRSDFVAFAGGDITKSVRVDTNWHYNQDLNTTETLSASVRYQPEAGKTVSLRYRLGRDEEIYNGVFGKNRQIDGGIQWPIAKNYYMVARYNYSMTEKQALEKLLGVEYKSSCGCWGASVVAQNYVVDKDRTKNAIFFQLSLKDLGGLGNNSAATLRQAIPGYRNMNEVNKK